MEINKINYHRNVFETFSKQAVSILNKLKDEFEKPEINISSSINNDGLFFDLWGIKIIIKTEILFDVKNQGFYFGEINSYILNKEEETLILTYHFDNIGNIENRFLLNDFTIPYYSNLIEKIIDFSNTENIKFKL